MGPDVGELWEQVPYVPELYRFPTHVDKHFRRKVLRDWRAHIRAHASDYLMLRSDDPDDWFLAQVALDKPLRPHISDGRWAAIGSPTVEAGLRAQFLHHFLFERETKARDIPKETDTTVEVSSQHISEVSQTIPVPRLMLKESA